MIAMLLGCAASLAATPDWAVAVFPGGAQFGLEIAADPPKRNKGYMLRESIGPEEGMLFIFETKDYHGFWMKNCLVALDIIWLDEDLRAVHLVRDIPPCEGVDCPTVFPLKPAKYVLEVAAGTTAAHGFEKGDRIVILAEPPLE